MIYTGVLRGLVLMIGAYRYTNPRLPFILNERRNPFKPGLLFCFVILETYTYLLRKGRLDLRSLTNCT